VSYRLGVDVGGTFTDLLVIDEKSGRTFRDKVPSTPHDPSQAVIAGEGRAHLVALLVPADGMDETAVALAVERANKMLSVTERIRRLLRRYLAEEMPSLEAVSDMLATTPQTLRRRLQREGQGYQMIKDALRRDVAVEFLTQSDLPLLEVAARVGFSEASTFHRAFKGWTGLTPGAYRQAHNEPAEGAVQA
jgi:AraC-like DNA-binding protein